MERARAIREKVLGEHPEDLAALLRAQGHIAAALPLQQRALAVSERCLISMTKALKKYGLNHSAASASELLQVIHKILHDRPRRKLH